MPGSYQTTFLKYLGKVYGCEPDVGKIDAIISEKIESDFNGYMESILDRENISMANLDLFGKKAVDELGNEDVVPGIESKKVYSYDFPKDRYVWTYGTTPIIQPSWLKERGAKSLDQALDLIRNDLDDAIRKGCRALKSQIAYYRTLQIRRVEHSEAERAYKILLRAKPHDVERIFGATVPKYGSVELNKSLKTLQDFLIRHLLLYAGREGIPFNFHVMSMDIAETDPRNNYPPELFSILRDKEVQKTRIVILHAGFPFYQQAAVLPLQFYLASSNVYLDLSAVCYYYSPMLRDILMYIMSITPVDKVLFGTDSGPLAETYGYTTWTMKTVFSDVFDELMQRYWWTESECLRAANMIFNENAKKLLKI